MQNTTLTLDQEDAIIAGLEQEWDEFSSNFYTLLPTRVRVGMLLAQMQDVTDIISEFMPINSWVSTETRNKIQGGLIPPDDFTNTFSNAVGMQYQTNQYWDSLRQVDSNTLVNFNTSVGWFELGVLTFNINWGALEAVAGLAAQVLKPALSILTDTYSEMGEFLADENKTKVQASTKQLAWVAKLYNAKGLLQGYTAETTGDDGFAMAAEQAQVDEIFQELQVMIEEHHDSNPHELAQEVANDRLGNFSQSLTGLTSGSIPRLLSGAQSCRISLTSAKQQDTQLAGKCKQFIDAVEDLEGFQDMEDFFNSLFDGLGNSELGAQIADALRMGSLSALLSELGGPWEDIASWLIGCISGVSVEDIDKIIEKKKQQLQEAISEALSFSLKIPSLSEWEAWKKKKEQILNYLRDKWEMYEEMISKLEDPRNLLQFSLYELDPEDPCSPASIGKAINDLIKKFLKECEESWEELSESAGGMIIAILLIILTDWVTSQLNSLVQQFGLDTLFGNALKALLNFIAMILVVMNGAKIYMQYLAVKALYNEVLLRKEFVMHMHSEFSYLVTLLQMMQLADFGKNDVFMEIVEAMGWIRKSKVRVGLELGKALNGKQPSKSSLVTAEGYIQNAIDALAAEGEMDVVNNLLAINELLDEYDINVDLFLFTDPELQQLTAAVRARFFSTNEESQQQYEDELEYTEEPFPEENYLNEEAYDDFYESMLEQYSNMEEPPHEELVMCQLPTPEQYDLIENGIPSNDPLVWPPNGPTVQMMPNECIEAHGNYPGYDPNEEPDAGED